MGVFEHPARFSYPLLDPCENCREFPIGHGDPYSVLLGFRDDRENLMRAVNVAYEDFRLERNAYVLGFGRHPTCFNGTPDIVRARFPNGKGTLKSPFAPSP